MPPNARFDDCDACARTFKFCEQQARPTYRQVQMAAEAWCRIDAPPPSRLSARWNRVSSMSDSRSMAAATPLCTPSRMAAAPLAKSRKQVGSPCCHFRRAMEADVARVMMPKTPSEPIAISFSAWSGRAGRKVAVAQDTARCGDLGRDQPVFRPSVPVGQLASPAMCNPSPQGGKLEGLGGNARGQLRAPPMFVPALAQKCRPAPKP